jgi:hypothetical protein
MDSLLSHPAVQSGIIPFIVAFPLVLFLGKSQPKLTGFAVIAAFTVTIGLVMGYSLTPFTSTKKIISITYAAAILGLILDISEKRWDAYRQYIHAAFAVAAAVGFLWVIWPVVSRGGSHQSILMVAGLCIYVAWMSFGFSVAYKKTEHISAAVFALAIGTSIVCIVGATALYGQLTAPFAAATGAWLLYYLLMSGSLKFPSGFYLPAVFICAVLGAAATVFASLDWSALLIFALLPLMTWIPVKAEGPTWIKLLKTSFATLVPVFAAIWYTVHQSAQNGYYG